MELGVMEILDLLSFCLSLAVTLHEAVPLPFFLMAASILCAGFKIYLICLWACHYLWGEGDSVIWLHHTILS